MSLELITHRGKTIIFVDYSVCKSDEELLQHHAEFEQLVIKQPGKVLALGDVTNTKLNTEFMATAKNIAKRTLNDKLEKGAFLGVTGLKKVLLNGFNLASKIKFLPFESKAEALEYLAKED